MDILPIITAFGFGAIVTTFLQMWMTSKIETKKRNFQEKKECYVGLIEAFRDAGNGVQNYKGEFAYWSVRCSLVGSKKLILLIEEMKTEDSVRQKLAFDKLTLEMRRDLGVSKD